MNQQESRPEEDFWPTVKKWLETRSGLQPLPTCPVCYCQLDVNGIDPLPSIADGGIPADNSGDSRDPDLARCAASTMAAILPCGHMMCHRCIDMTMYMSADNQFAAYTNHSQHIIEKTPDCPICRAPPRGKNKGCRHHAHYHVPLRSIAIDNLVANVPLTTSEGGSVLDQCLACEMWEKIKPQIDGPGDDYDSDHDSDGDGSDSDSTSEASSIASSCDNLSHDGNQQEKRDVESPHDVDFLHDVDFPHDADSLHDVNSPHDSNVVSLHDIDSSDRTEMNPKPITVSGHCCYYSLVLRRKSAVHQVCRVLADVEPFNDIPTEEDLDDEERRTHALCEH